MNNLNEIVVRIKADTSSFNSPIDVLRGELSQFWRGNDIRFEIGIFNGDDVLSVSNYASISLAIRKMTEDGKVPFAGTPALMQKICTSFDNTVIALTWQDGTKQHAVIPFSSEESNVISGDHWLLIWATTLDAEPKIVTLCAGIIRILEVGDGVSSIPPDPIEIDHRSDECKDMFIPLTSIDTSINLGTFNFVMPSQGAVKSYVDEHSNLKSAISASNLGTGVGVFWRKNDTDLRFQGLKAGDHVTISSNSSENAISPLGNGSSSGLTNPMTSQGDMIIGAASGIAKGLEKGTNDQV
jgi:hypothetical protein